MKSNPMFNDINVFYVALVLLLEACTISKTTINQIVTEPPVFITDRPMTFRTGSYHQYSIEVPRGFVTDLASIPKGLWWWTSPHEGTLGPAVIHDFLYWVQPCTKDEADAVMYLAMMETGMSKSKINKVYLGIRTPFANNAWEKNNSAYKSGERRFFSNSYTESLVTSDVNSKITLEDIQKDASYQDSSFIPVFQTESIKKACIEAYAEFKELNR